MAASVLVSCLSASASRVLRKQLQSEVAGSVSATAKVVVDEEGMLSVTSSHETPQTIPLLVLDDPDVKTMKHAIRGRISYDGVVGESYLEMWTCYGGDERYFTRTLARGGSMKTILGTSDWRPFALPFTANKEEPPTAIELNLILGGPGEVWLRDVSLVEFGIGEDPLRLAGAWWGPRGAGLFAGVIGGLIGVIGGVIGWLTGKGKARTQVLRAARVLSVMGVVILSVGAIAFLMGQPVEVIYPLVLVGALTVVVFGTSRKSIFRSYELRQKTEDIPPAGSPPNTSHIA